MKKLLLTLLVAVTSLTASAQVYVGGGVGVWRNPDANTTNLYIAPEAGYCLSDKWALGLSFGYAHSYNEGRKVNGLQVDPYARFNFVKFGPVSLFVDMGFGVATYKEKDYDDSFTAWNIGVKPGVKVSLTKQIDFVAHLGFLGYRDSDEGTGLEEVYGDNGFGFDLNATNVMFGIYYNF